ncbi:MAG TPA: alpha-galactosidase [Bryobacteraceae bacterium]|nr:alpha-galactosidase [Bryobacteraceae bacterium]
MKVSRRDFGCLLAGGLAGARGVAAAAGEWTIGAQRVALRGDQFACTSLVDAGRREWIHPAAVSDEFQVQIDDAVLTGSSGWRLAGVKESLREHGWQETAIALDAIAHPVRVTRHYASHPDLPVIRQWTSVTNTGAAPVTVKRLDTFRLRLGPAPLELRWLNNFGRAMLPSPGNPIQSRAIAEDTEQAIRTGPYSPDCAWFSLSLPAGDALIGGWEWSGPMAIEFSGGVDPCLVSGGLDSNQMAEPLAAGACMSAPVGWYGFVHGDQDEAAALSHALVREALGPPLPELDFPWAAYCTWATAIDEKQNPHNEPGTHPWFPTERNLLGQVDAAAEIGCELFLWDYGWFPRVGDWWFDPARFPEGPRRVSRAVRQRGMKLGLWFGFGNADQPSQVVREHPDWLAEYRGKPIPDDFFIRTAASTWNTRILCLAHRPVREWVKQQLARVIDAAELDWLKHDFDLITICQARHHSHPPGDSRVASCAAFYEIMDFVRSRYPKLVCEQWMNDSAVPDYGVAQRHHVQLIGDAYESFRLRQMVYGHLQIFPLDRQQRYLRLEQSAGDLATVLQSSMIGGPWTLLSDPRLMTPEQRRILTREIGLYKRFRPLAASGRVYRLIERPHPRGWDAFELWDERRGEGAVYVFRNRHPSAVQPVVLRGLARGARYQAEFIRRPSSARWAGAELMQSGLRVALPAENSCELISLRRVPA